MKKGHEQPLYASLYREVIETEGLILLKLWDTMRKDILGRYHSYENYNMLISMKGNIRSMKFRQ